jgi:hypothetical protein
MFLQVGMHTISLPKIKLLLNNLKKTFLKSKRSMFDFSKKIPWLMNPPSTVTPKTTNKYIYLTDVKDKYLTNATLKN